MRRMLLAIVGAMVLTTFGFVGSQSPPTTPQTSQTAAESAEMRPAKAKKILVKRLPVALEGIVVEGGKFKLKPGYKFVPQTDNKMSIAMKAGGYGVKGSFSCECQIGKGGCSIVTIDDMLSCNRNKETPCSNHCLLITTIDGNSTKLAIF